MDNALTTSIAATDILTVMTKATNATADVTRERTSSVKAVPVFRVAQHAMVTLVATMVRMKEIVHVHRDSFGVSTACAFRKAQNVTDSLNAVTEATKLIASAMRRSSCAPSVELNAFHCVKNAMELWTATMERMKPTAPVEKICFAVTTVNAYRLVNDVTYVVTAGTEAMN